MPIITIQPKITDEDLARMLGGPKRTIPESLMPSVRHWRTRVLEMAEPAAAYSMLRVESAGGGKVKIEGGPEFECKTMAAGMKKCEEAVAFIVTLGGALEVEMTRLNSEGNLSDAYMLDAISSAAVENMGLQLALKLEAELAAQGRSLTWHYSPGNCDWDVAEQKKLFPLVDHEKIGVRLTDSCLMIPKKSVSGIIGILPYISEKSIADRNPCTRCNKSDCFARRV